ncbi:MAG TPA: alpha/beta hydrolase [Solirubrobacteraceae bacterium]|jgi:pimeloyl-ACP methyl ester carboxylesterase
MSRTAIATNGVELSVLDEGAGPLVVLCHGFPELAYSWRHQIPALTEAGYRVVAPDMRGFGESSIPERVEDYDVVSLCGDMTGLLDALDEQQAIFVGHDWGANVVWQLAVLAPERVRAVAGLSVPFVPRAPAAPIPIMRRHLGEDFYIVWFQQPGVADEALARDVRRTLTTSRQWTADWAVEDGHEPRLAVWLSEQELAVYVTAFERTGFTGGLNWYRNIDRNWELTAAVAERHVEQPAMFLTGELDPVRRFMPAEAMHGRVDDLRAEIVVAGAGHWVQQQAPHEVNAALLEFFAGL